MKATTVYGPPGTGKTRRLIDIAHDSCQMRQGLFLSYTKAAALEAASRIKSDNVRASTLHSLAFQRLNLGRASVVDAIKLREFSAASGIPFKGADGAEGIEEGDEYVSIYSYAHNRILGMLDAYDRFGRPGNPKRFEMFVIAYEQWKQTYGYMDFDDMLIRASKMKFPHVPVIIGDEMQDCSPLQWSVFEQVCASAKEVYVAGDDDQAIYEWSGADPHGMDKFGTRYSAGTEVLSKSYRLPLRVHEKAEDLINRIDRRVVKDFSHAGHEGMVTRWGDFKVMIPLAENRTALIMCRDNFRLRELQTELHEEGVPYAMATSNGPYENRHARAIRGWQRDGVPEEDEREAMLQIAMPDAMKLVQDRNWKALRAFHWRRCFKLPPRMLDFYERADLFAPLRVKLSTIHQAKGSEADIVTLDLAMTPRVEAGIDLNRDAEIRVWYVGMTRAKHELHLTGENPLVR